jgi:hypothetical protein
MTSAGRGPIFPMPYRPLLHLPVDQPDVDLKVLNGSRRLAMRPDSLAWRVHLGLDHVGEIVWVVVGGIRFLTTIAVLPDTINEHPSI